MSLDNSQYDSIIRSYEEKQNRNRRLLEERTAYVYARVEGFRELDESTASVSVEQGRKLLRGDKTALEELKSILAGLSSRKEKLLLSAGLPADYLSPVYDCPDCRDTGYTEGRKCHCFRQAEIDLLYEQSNIRHMLDQENFTTLSYSYYEGQELEEFKRTVEKCRQFVRDFDSRYGNLFFYGTVGTGKSFLSGCVAKELIENGRSVLYFSASALFNLLSENLYGNRDTQEDLYGCDLLIIDDLGTELTNSFVSSQLFSCLNERYLRRKPVIISTNLSLEQLKNRYSDRIFSRIISNFEVIKLSGPNIRMMKKRMANRK